MKEIFQKIREAGIKANPKKCKIGKQKVTYLGYEISEKGISPDKVKTRLVDRAESPRSPKEIMRFLGLANYYRRFIQNYSMITAPMRTS